MGNTLSSYREFAQQVCAAADIAEVVGQYVELKRAGANLKGLCPFHQEKTPSFHVHPSKQIYKCFGCGKSGNVIGFVREIERADFRQALEILANKYGLEVPRFSAHGPDEEQVKLRQGMGQALEAAAQYYQKRLAHPQHGSRGRQYLKERGLEQSVIEAFRLGVAGEDGSGLGEELQKKGFSAHCLRDAGLVRQRKDGNGWNDYFRGRLIFPITDARGGTIGFGGRAFTKEEQPKYLNTAETDLFRKGQELYGLFNARDTLTRQQAPAVLVEGYMDVIGCHQAGVTSAVASMGTALTPEQARLIKRYSKEVVFLYDADEAGIKAILRGLDVLLGAGLSVRVGSLPKGEDPDSYAKANGPEALRKVVATAAPFFEFLLGHARTQYDMNSPEEKLRALEIFEPPLAAISEELVYNEYVARLALVMGHDEDALRRYLKKHARPAPRREGPGQAEARKPAADAGDPKDSLDSAVLSGAGPASPLEKALLHILIEHAEARDLMRGRLQSEWVAHPLVRHWVTRVIELDSAVTDVWPELIAQCGSPDHENFLQDVIFSSEGNQDDYLPVAQHIVDRLAAGYRRGQGQRLQLRLQQLDSQTQGKDETLGILQEQMENLQTRFTEMERAKSNPCVRVKHLNKRAND